MSGTTSRRGFKFSDVYILDAALSGCLDSQLEILENSSSTPETVFGVEAAPEGSDSDWDVLTIKSMDIEVQEVKSGSVTAVDRKTFWIRLRKTISETSGTNQKVLPRLVINSDSIPTSYNAWKNFSKQLPEYSDQSPPESAPIRVDSSSKMLREALFWMCTAEVLYPDVEKSPKIAAPKIPIKVAIQVLEDFDLIEVSGREMVSRFVKKLRALFDGISPEHVYDKLCGWVSRKAEDYKNENKFFSVRTLVAEAEIFKQFISRPTSVSRLAQYIFNECEDLISQYLDSKIDSQGISEVPLELTQPAISALNLTQELGVLILGEAGSGKSVVLSQLCEKILDDFKVYRFRATDLAHWNSMDFKEDFHGAVRFLADIQILKNRKSFFVVDEFDQAPRWLKDGIMDSVNKLVATNEVRFIISTRLVDWIRAPYENPLTEFSLQPWDEGIVDSILESKGIQRRLSDSLKCLIRIPFYLDIFVRTFASEDEIPDNLESRHGLVKFFWKEKIDKHTDHEDHWLLLGELINQESKGSSFKISMGTPTKIEKSINYLASNGIISRPSKVHSVTFRHPLFLGFANSQKIMLDHEAETYRAIKEIKSPVLRWNTHRSLIEAIAERNKVETDPKMSIDEYIRSDPEAISEDMADILGDFHNVNEIHWEQWEGLSPFFGERLLRAAKHAKNYNWVGCISSWPDSIVWMKTRAWMTPDFFRELYNYLKKAEISDVDVKKKLSARLRSWSSSEMFSHPNVLFILGMMVEIVVCLDPSNESVDWLEKISLGENYYLRTKSLEALNTLILENSNIEESMNKIVSIYRNCIGLNNKKDSFWRVNDNLWNSPTFDHSAIHWCLIGHRRKKAALLKHQPKYFLITTIELLEACWLREKERKIKAERERLKAMDPEDMKLLSIYREELTYPDVDELFYEDWPHYSYWGAGNKNDEVYLLSDAIENACRNLCDKYPDELNFVGDALSASRLPTAHAILAKLVTELPDSPEKNAIIRRQLKDTRLYKCHDMLFWLESHMRYLVGQINAKEIQVILDSAERVLEPEYFLHFAAQINQSKLPQNLRKPVKELLGSGGYHKLWDPSENRLSYGGWEWTEREPDDLEHFGDVATQQKVQKFREKTESRSYPIKFSKEDRIILCALIQEIESMIVKNPELIVSDPWLLESIRKLFLGCLDKEDGVNMWPGIDVAKRLSKILGDRALQQVSDEKLADFDEGRTLNTLFMRTIETINAICLHPEMKGTSEYTEVGKLVKSFMESGSISIKWCLIRGINEYHWFNFENVDQATVFTEVVDSRPPRALLEALFRHVRYLEPDQFLDINERFLNTLLENEATDFSRSLGEVIGRWCVHDSSEHQKIRKKAQGCNNLLKAVVTESNRFNLTKDVQNRSEFLWSSLFGLKEQASKSFSHDMAYTYTSVVKILFNSILGEGLTREKHSENFWLFATNWIADLVTSESESEFRPWIEPLFELMLKTCVDGSKYEIHSLFQQAFDAKTTPPSGLVFVLKPARYLELAEIVVKRSKCEEDPGEGDITKAKWQSWTNSLEEIGKNLVIYGESNKIEGSNLDRLINLLEVASVPPFKSAKCHELLARARAIGEQGN